MTLRTRIVHYSRSELLTDIEELVSEAQGMCGCLHLVEMDIARDYYGRLGEVLKRLAANVDFVVTTDEAETCITDGCEGLVTLTGPIRDGDSSKQPQFEKRCDSCLRRWWA